MINKITQMDNLDSNHDHAIDQDNERRLTGVNETSSIHDFSAGVANRSPDGEKKKLFDVRNMIEILVWILWKHIKSLHF